MVAGRHYLEQLDAMAMEIQNRLRQQRLPVDARAMPVINQYLFEELGFQTISHADDPNDLFLHSVMDRRQGYCLSLSILYLAVAERLGLDVYGVVVPGHFFVRYDPAAPGSTSRQPATGPVRRTSTTGRSSTSPRAVATPFI